MCYHNDYYCVKPLLWHEFVVSGWSNREWVCEWVEWDGGGEQPLELQVHAKFNLCYLHSCLVHVAKTQGGRCGEIMKLRCVRYRRIHENMYSASHNVKVTNFSEIEFEAKKKLLCCLSQHSGYIMYTVGSVYSRKIERARASEWHSLA